MRFDGVELVSLNDSAECFIPSNKLEQISKFCNDFSSIFTSKYIRDRSRCYLAEASDKTRHVLFEADLLLDIISAEFQPFSSTFPEFYKKFNEVLRKQYKIIDSVCCCCPKKLKKHLARSISFTDFVRKGEVDLKRFNALKSKINVLISLDIEAYEHSIDKLLEFGLSFYDLRTKTNENIHIIVTDHLHLQNGKYVANNRSNFNFGKSILLSLQSAIDRVHGELSVAGACLIGHNIKADIRFLASKSKSPISIPIFDTQIMYKQTTLGENILSLVRVLEELEIEYTNLHNAGNDAHYTLEVFKKIANI